MASSRNCNEYVRKAGETENEKRKEGKHRGKDEAIQFPTGIKPIDLYLDSCRLSA
jgi:hypothetical protein